jgi:hypothetical protein
MMKAYFRVEDPGIVDVVDGCCGIVHAVGRLVVSGNFMCFSSFVFSCGFIRSLLAVFALFCYFVDCAYSDDNIRLGSDCSRDMQYT